MTKQTRLWGTVRPIARQAPKRMTQGGNRADVAQSHEGWTKRLDQEKEWEQRAQDEFVDTCGDVDCLFIDQ